MTTYSDSASFVAAMQIDQPREGVYYSDAESVFTHIKRALIKTLPNLNSEVSATPAELNSLAGLTANFQVQLNNLNNTRDAMSASVQSTLDGMQASLVATKLSVSGTAVDTIRWGGARAFFQSATPSAAEGDIWFQI